MLLAARAAGISRQRCYKARQAEPAFEERWRQAEAEAVERLEVEARRRAMAHSDTLMLGLLRAHKPAMYDPRHRLEVSGPEGGPIPVTLVPEGLTDHERVLLRQAIDRELAARQAGEVLGRLRLGEHVDRDDLLLLAAAIEQTAGGEP